MPVSLPNFLSIPAQDYGAGDILGGLTQGYAASRMPRQLGLEEQRAQLANILLGHQGVNEGIKSRYLPQEYEANIANTRSLSRLHGTQSEANDIANRLERLYGEKNYLSQLNSRDAITRGHQLDNEIKQETGMLKALLGLQGDFESNKRQRLENEYYPADKLADIYGKLSVSEGQDISNEQQREYGFRKLQQEQDDRDLDLNLKRKYGELLTQLQALRENGLITGQEYSNEAQKIKNLYLEANEKLGVRQAEENVGVTQEQRRDLARRNEIEAQYAFDREDLKNQFLKGELSAQEYDNENKRINNKYQEDIKQNEVAQGKANIASTQASTRNTEALTRSQEFKNKLEGKYGEKDRALAYKQGLSALESSAAQNAGAWNKIERDMKYGDQMAAAKMQRDYEDAALKRAKLEAQLWENNKKNAAYKGIPEGSVPITEFSRSAQTKILSEQAEDAKRIESAEKGLRKLDEMEKILARNEGRKEFSESWQLALTSQDKDGVISALAKVLVPGQNKQQRADAETFKKLATDFVLDQGSSAMGSRFTDAKLRAMQASKPYLFNTAKANKAVINQLRKELKPFVKYKKDFQKARDKYTIHFDYDKYSDRPIEELTDEELERAELSAGLKE